MTPPTPRTIATLLLMLVMLLAPAPIDAQAPVPGDAQSPAPTNAASGDQPQLVSTGASTFWNSFGYLLVTLLAGGALYAVCRSSHRT